MASRVVIGLAMLIVGIQVGTWNGKQVAQAWQIPSPDVRYVYADAFLGASVGPLGSARTGSEAGVCGEVAEGLRRAGWDEDLVPTMVAVSMVEAGCKTEATRSNVRERSLGALQ